MASLDTLPPDQRAVLQMVLQQGRTYDEIAEMLRIDRAGVRDRALAAFDALGPQTRLPAERRGLITDYLLGQLPESVGAQTRDRLGEAPSERAWARVLSSELAPIARGSLPEIPVDSGDREPVGVAVAEPEEPERKPDRSERKSDRSERTEPPGEVEAPDDQPVGAGERPASRRGGAILLGLVGLAAVAALVIVLIASGGSSSKHTTSSAVGASRTSTPAGTSTTGTQLVAQVNLVPTTPSKKMAGLAQIVRQAANLGLVIVAQGMPANTAHDAYAVWLYNSPGDSHILGFVNPGVKADGKLQTAGVLPANASRYKQLLVTLETQAKPSAPGKIVLQGALKL